MRNESSVGGKNQGNSTMNNCKCAPELVTLPVWAQHNFNNLLWKVTFNPRDDLLLCTSGAMEFKVWRLVDGVFKSA